MSRDVKYIGMDVHKAGLDVFAAGYPATYPLSTLRGLPRDRARATLEAERIASPYP